MSVFRLTKNVLTRGVVCASLLASLSFPLTRPAAARVAGPSAEGNVTFSTGDGANRSLQFSATTDTGGRVEGGMSFSGPADIPDQDVDGAGYEGFTGSVSNLLISARLDGLVTQGNRAVMSGTVTASNLGEYIGRRVLLVVEDNGAAGGDKFTWGLYKPADITWTPSDYERRGHDDGWSLRWTATDYERRDDAGIPMPPSTAIDCDTFPLASHDFADTRDLEGNILVNQ